MPALYLSADRTVEALEAEGEKTGSRDGVDFDGEGEVVFDDVEAGLDEGEGALICERCCWEGVDDLGE